MTYEEIQKIIQNLESDRIEKNVSVDKTEKFCEAICAFSNDLPNYGLPGYLVIGVDDLGNRCGLDISDTLLTNLGQIRNSGNIQPLPSMTVEKVSFPDHMGDIALVTVRPALQPPVRYKGRVYIRIGPKKDIATEQEERALTEKRISHALTFDARPCYGSSLFELSEELFRITYLPNAISRDVLEKNNRSYPEQLASLRFYDVKSKSPTNAGILLFGEDPLRWLPGAYIQFVRFLGDKLTDPVVEEESFTGDLLTVLRSLTQFVSAQIQRYPEYVNALQEHSSVDYPVRAIREILMNAIMHRNYEGATSPIRFYWFSDRIEIQNPGGLFGEATQENFPKQTAYRNPVIAEAMKQLGYVNRFGVGVAIAQDELQKNGNPPADYTFESNHVLVTLRKRP